MLVVIAFCLVPLSVALAAIQTATVDDAGNMGMYSSLVLDADSNPMISYYDNNDRDLKYVHCGDPACASGNAISILDSATSTGTYTSIVINASGNPQISYRDESNGLKLLTCGNPDCSSGNVITIVDSDSDRGAYNSLKLDSSGNPVISYYDRGGDNLRLVHCGDATCSAGNVYNIVDSGSGAVGQFTSLELDSSGFPVISYYDQGNQNLNLAHCADADCSAGTVVTAVDFLQSVGTYTSLKLDSSGNPVISYHNAQETSLMLAYCNDANCTTSTLTEVEESGNTGVFTSLELDASGNPMISYRHAGNNQLKLAECGNPTCSSGNVFSVVSSGGGQWSSIAMDCADNPVISFFHSNTTSLRLAYDDSSGCGPAASSSANVAFTKEIETASDTSISLGRIYVLVPDNAIDEDEAYCRIVIAQKGDSGDFGFELDDTMWDVKIVCDSGEITLLFAPLSVCIRPKGGVTVDKQVFHRHDGSWNALTSTGEVSGYVCGQTQMLSLFTLGTVGLPETGFAMGTLTQLPAQPAELAYTASDLVLTIPTLGLSMDIVGVPQGPNGWDVSWLGSDAGWLTGTGFPTMAGNSVLTAHVWNADNTSGPFAKLGQLQYGDRLSISAWGSTYTYEVRSNSLVSPSSVKPLEHEDYDWVTLITCQYFNESTGEYALRRVVRAVLVRVE